MLYFCFLFVFVLYLLCPMLPVFLDCQYLLAPSVFSNLYLLLCPSVRLFKFTRGTCYFPSSQTFFFNTNKNLFFFYMKLFFLKVYQGVLYKSAGSIFFFFSSFISRNVFPLEFTTDKKKYHSPMLNVWALQQYMIHIHLTFVTDSKYYHILWR